MHIRKLVVKQFKIKNFNTPKDIINKVNAYIISLNPKDLEPKNSDSFALQNHQDASHRESVIQAPFLEEIENKKQDQEEEEEQNEEEQEEEEE
jgi:hypothetical protein